MGRWVRVVVFGVLGVLAGASLFWAVRASSQLKVETDRVDELESKVAELNVIRGVFTESGINSIDAVGIDPKFKGRVQELSERYRERNDAVQKLNSEIRKLQRQQQVLLDKAHRGALEVTTQTGFPDYKGVEKDRPEFDKVTAELEKKKGELHRAQLSLQESLTARRLARNWPEQDEARPQDAPSQPAGGTQQRETESKVALKTQ
jgi:hypothetical protein